MTTITEKLAESVEASGKLRETILEKVGEIDDATLNSIKKIDEHINLSKELLPRIVITRNQELDFDASNGFPLNFSFATGVTPSLHTIINNYKDKSDDAVAMLREMSDDMGAELSINNYYRRDFKVFKLSWSGKPPWLAYPECSDSSGLPSIPLNTLTTIGAFVKVLSGEIYGSWTEGNQVGKWTFCRQHYSPAYFGSYIHLHPIPVSDSGELLVALPAAITGFIDKPEQWFPNIQLG